MKKEKLEEVKLEEVKLEEVKLEEVKLEEVKLEEVKLEEVQELITNIKKEIAVKPGEDDVKKDTEDNAVLSLEKEQSSYFKTLDLNSIENEATKKISEEIISSPLNLKDKRENLKKIITQNSIKTCLKKSENIENAQVNAFALQTLKNLNKLGQNLNETQIIQAESAIATLDVDFQRIGKENLSRGLDSQVDMGSFTAIQQLNSLMKKYQQKQDPNLHGIAKNNLSHSPNSQVDMNCLGTVEKLHSLIQNYQCLELEKRALKPA